MIRGDDTLSSLMEEMSGGSTGMYAAAPTTKPTTPRVRIRLVPEVQGYGENMSCPESGQDGNIWNPNVCTLSTPEQQQQQLVVPTNPLVEISRRRGYEKFKKEFYDTFAWNAKHAAASAKDVTNEDHASLLRLWEKVPSHAILERWHFACKLEESLRISMLQNETEDKVIPHTSLVQDSLGIVTASSIRTSLMRGRSNGLIMDPILLTQLQSKKTHGKDKDQASKGGSSQIPSHVHLSSGTLLQNEIKFQFIREWKKSKRENSTDDEKEQIVLDFFSSSKFSKKCQKIIRDVNHVATNVENEFHADLLKSAKQLEESSSSLSSKRKRSIPRVSLFSSPGDTNSALTPSNDALMMTHHGLSFKISHAHYQKLQILFDRNNPSSTSLTSHRDAFHSHLFSLLARYDMLEGAGLQSSLNGNVFDVLLNQFQCNMECFASPFNCRYERFCSAFPDTDTPFGSMGSFFNFKFESLTEGACFQANPPFVADFILAMQRRMEGILIREELKIPFMFIVFIPAWKESSGWVALRDSKVCVHHLFLSQKDDPHYYCEGTQHRRSKRYRVASFDTSVFFLQNTAARTKWPISDLAIEELKTAFGSNPGDETEQNEVSEKSNRRNGKVKGKIIGVESTKSSENMDVSSRKSEPSRKKKLQKKGSTNKKRRKLMADSGEDQLKLLTSLGLSFTRTEVPKKIEKSGKKKRRQRK